MDAGEERYRFALLAHSGEIVEECRKIMGGSRDEIRYEIIDFESGPVMARQCLCEGYEVILCHGGTGDTIFRSVPRSVVKIERTDMDVLRALLFARQYSGRIVLSSYQDEFHEGLPREMERLLNIEVRNAVYDSPESMRRAIRRCVRDNFKVLIGGGVSKACMEEFGGRGFIIKPTPRSIGLAFERARHLAHARREAKRRNGNMMLILEQLQEGVLCIDSQRRVLIANKAAYRLLNAPPQAGDAFFSQFFQPLGLLDTLEDLTPRENILVEVRGEGFMATTYPLTLYSDTPCAVSLFRDTPSLQNISSRISRELCARGLSARTGLADILGGSAPIRHMREKLRQYAPAEANIFIQGETGSGKELAAHALHAGSARRNHPFVPVNICAVPAQLLESELFGYEEGAFTGARRGGKAGYFEMAHQGTLFLDEIGDISEETQLRLLRVLETREVLRVGGNRMHPVDVRVVCASNKPLLELVRLGRFRRDLYYRLSTFKLAVPPLRQRLEDIPALLAPLLQKYRRGPEALTPAVLSCLRGHDWPGNVRELRAVFENYLLLLGDGAPDAGLLAAILAEHDSDSVGLPAGMDAPDARQRCAAPERGEPVPAPLPPLSGEARGGSLRAGLDLARDVLVRQAMEACGGDRRAAARRLGIGYSSLCRMLRGAGTARHLQSRQ